jgi:hypothetical protein
MVLEQAPPAAGQPSGDGDAVPAAAVACPASAFRAGCR